MYLDGKDWSLKGLSGVTSVSSNKASEKIKDLRAERLKGKTGDSGQVQCRTCQEKSLYSSTYNHFKNT